MTDPKNFPVVAPIREDGGGSQLTVQTASGKPKRKPIPVKVQVSVVINQALWHGMSCPLCKLALMPDQPRVLEHMVPHATMTALGRDPDDIDNLRFVHAECAAKKTNGNKATCADGDIHRIAKSKRLAVARAVHDAVKRGEHVRPASRIKGRGFAKVHRPMRRPQP